MDRYELYHLGIRIPSSCGRDTGRVGILHNSLEIGIGLVRKGNSQGFRYSGM